MPLRPYLPSDLPDLREICIRTGDAGQDATATYPQPQLIAAYFAEPYAAYAPELCLILSDTAGACGYVIGAVDTRDYIDWFNREWRPSLEEQVRQAEVAPGAVDAWLYDLIRQPASAPPWVDAYPAHLHIDLLPRAQGQGWGRRMMRTWMELAARRGATGVHLAVAPSNAGAIAFYARIGLSRLPAGDGAVAFGLRISPRDSVESPIRESSNLSARAVPNRRA